MLLLWEYALRIGPECLFDDMQDHDSIAMESSAKFPSPLTVIRLVANLDLSCC